MGPLFGFIAKEYYQNKHFAEYPKQCLHYRLRKNILPFFGNLHVLQITDQIVDNYVKTRRAAGRQMSTVSRELTDVKAILNWGVHRNPPLIRSNPIRDYKKPAHHRNVSVPPTRAETEKIFLIPSGIGTKKTGKPAIS